MHLEKELASIYGSKDSLISGNLKKGVFVNF